MCRTGSVTTRGGAIPSCILGDLSKDTNPSRALAKALALEGPEAGVGHMGGTGWKAGNKQNRFPLAGCAPAPTHPKGPFLNKYLNHLLQTQRDQYISYIHVLN